MIEEEVKIDALYVKNVIEPLEKIIRDAKFSKKMSKNEIKKLEILLLEKYLYLESVLRKELEIK